MCTLDISVLLSVDQQAPVQVHPQKHQVWYRQLTHLNLERIYYLKNCKVCLPWFIVPACLSGTNAIWMSQLGPAKSSIHSHVLSPWSSLPPLSLLLLILHTPLLLHGLPFTQISIRQKGYAFRLSTYMFTDTLDTLTHHCHRCLQCTGLCTDRWIHLFHWSRCLHSSTVLVCMHQC